MNRFQNHQKDKKMEPIWKIKRWNLHGFVKTVIIKILPGQLGARCVTPLKMGVVFPPHPLDKDDTKLIPNGHASIVITQTSTGLNRTQQDKPFAHGATEIGNISKWYQW